MIVYGKRDMKRKRRKCAWVSSCFGGVCVCMCVRVGGESVEKVKKRGERKETIESIKK